MIRKLLRRALRQFEKRYGYDARYMHEIIAADVGGALRMGMATKFLEHRFDTPRDAYFAAKLRSVGNADCGPCLALVIRMAEEAGVGVDTIAAALGAGEGSPDVELAIRYADAVAANTADLVEVVAEARERFGAGGLPGLATAVVAGQFYPVLKRGMGHGSACEPVRNSYLRQHGRLTPISKARELAA